MRAFKYILVLCLLPGWVAVRAQDVPPDELYSADRPLDEVVVEGKLMRPDDIKQILGGFFNASDFSDALQAYRVKNDKDLTTLFADFEKATTVKIVPRSYIDFSSFWFDRVREWAEEDYAEAVLGQTRFISDEIIFLPLADGSYEVQLRLTPSLLLEQEGGIGRPMLDARAEAVRLRYWNGSSFGSPKEARPAIATGHGELLGQLKGEIADAGLAEIDPEKEDYYRRMGNIIQNPEQPFREQLNVMWEAYKFFSLCVDQGWESHRENGLVPYCFWKDQSDPRVPFLAGVVDAAYIDTEAMSHLPELIEQIRESALELTYAYIVGSFRCPEDELIENKEEYREIVTRMALGEPSFGAWKWLEEMVTTTDKERIDELESFFNGCEKVVAYREKLAEIKDFMQDWQAMLAAYLEIESRVTTYLEVLEAGDDESWYERGFLTSQAALAVLPVGNFSKTKKARQVVELLKDESNWVRVTDEVGVEAGRLAQYAGKATKGVKNLLALESPTGLFRQLKGTNGQTYRAATFWTDEGESILHYVSKDAKYYIKHDPSNGRVLFVDVGRSKFMGFMLDQDNIIRNNYEALVENLKTIHGLPNSVRTINIKGTPITFADDKANLVLGKYRPNSSPGISGEIGTDDVIEQMTILKNYSFADKSFELRNGSIHVLNIPDGNVTQWGTFFEDYNKQLLDLAIQNANGFKTIFVSDPRKAALLRGTVVIDGKYIPSGFAKEIRYLRDGGIKTVNLKDGTLLNLDNIDLSSLNWAGWQY